MGNSGAPCFMSEPTGVPPAAEMCTPCAPLNGLLVSTLSVAPVVVTVHAAARSAAEVYVSKSSHRIAPGGHVPVPPSLAGAFVSVAAPPASGCVEGASLAASTGLPPAPDPAAPVIEPAMDPAVAPAVAPAAPTEPPAAPAVPAAVAPP